jgi:hypothetical protein
MDKCWRSDSLLTPYDSGAVFATAPAN